MKDTSLFEFAKVFAGLGYFGLMGCGILFPWFNRKFIWLAAPLAGFALHSLGTGCFYTILKLDYSVASIASFTVGAVLTLIAIGALRPSFDFRIGLPILILAAGVSCIICDLPSIQAGPSILFTDGTDHAGYAALADWFRDHKVSIQPIASPEAIYQNWPEFIVHHDPRFGSFSVLATIAEFSRVDAIFAYDLAGSIALAAGALGVAAGFASGGISLTIAVIGLMVSHWLDYQHGGYLGKLLAFPSALLIIGLFRSADTKYSLAPLCIMAAGVAGLHSGIASALVVASTVAPVLIFQRYWEQSRNTEIVDRASTLFAVLLVLVVTTGSTTRSTNLVFPDYGLNWSYVLPRILDIENQGVWITGLTQEMVRNLVVLAILLWVFLLLLAVRSKHAVATGILFGSSALFGALLMSGSTAATFQLIGFFYPISICAAVALLDSLIDGKRQLTITLIVLGCVVASILLRVPRFIGAVDRYVLHPDYSRVFRESKINEMMHQAGQEAILVQTKDLQPTLILLIELGRRHENIQWSDDAWKIVLAGRKWSQPKWSVAPKFIVKEGAEGSFDLSPAP